MFIKTMISFGQQFHILKIWLLPAWEKLRKKIISLLKYARGTVSMKHSRPFHFNVWQNSLQIKKKKKKETVFSSFPTAKQKRNSHPKWDHITTGRMRKMSNSFGPSLLHRWKGEHGKMVIFQETPLATQIQTSACIGMLTSVSCLCRMYSSLDILQKKVSYSFALMTYIMANFH